MKEKRAGDQPATIDLEVLQAGGADQFVVDTTFTVQLEAGGRLEINSGNGEVRTERG